VKHRIIETEKHRNFEQQNFKTLNINNQNIEKPKKNLQKSYFRQKIFNTALQIFLRGRVLFNGV
jgi:hypothetical protein